MKNSKKKKLNIEADKMDMDGQIIAEATNPEETAAEVEMEDVVADEAGAELSCEDELAEARAEAAKNLDGWMRVQAEFANARKRMEKERVDTYANARADMASKLLPVMDDFERALANLPEEIVGNSWLEGIELVQRKLTGILEGMNVKLIEAVGQPFDPNYHEAIMQESSDEHESGTVSKVLQQGYRIGERVIRPALVYVAE